MMCNKPDEETVETNLNEEEPAIELIDDNFVVVNKLERFWNGDGYWNGRLAIDYINMCEHAQHNCEQCNYVSVMNEGTAPGRTGGWQMQFCHKFNFKLGDSFKGPPYTAPDV